MCPFGCFDSLCATIIGGQNFRRLKAKHAKGFRVRSMEFPGSLNRYISGIHCQLGDYMVPIPPIKGNQKQPLIRSVGKFMEEWFLSLKRGIFFKQNFNSVGVFVFPRIYGALEFLGFLLDKNLVKLHIVTKKREFTHQNLWV